jgi:hypothetical protein
MNAVKVIDSPGAPNPAPNERRLKFLGIALALSFAVGVAGPGVVEYFNRPIQTEHDARQITGLPVLSAVPLVQSRRACPSSGPQSPVTLGRTTFCSDAIRRLRVEIQLAEEMPLHRILRASALPGGNPPSCTTSVWLWQSASVIIADADFHRPTHAPPRPTTSVAQRSAGRHEVLSHSRPRSATAYGWPHAAPG